MTNNANTNANDSISTDLNETMELLKEAIELNASTRPFRAHIITVGSLKGGVGKTTLSVQLAGFLAKRGFKVMLIDGDNQASAARWVGQAESDSSPLSKVHVANLAKLEGRLAREIRKHVDDYDFILVDCPPELGALMQSALTVSDLMLIPTRPSVLDIESAKETLSLAHNATGMNPELKIGFVMTHRRPNTILSTTSDDMIHQIVNTFQDPAAPAVANPEMAQERAAELAQEMQDLNVVFLKNSTHFRECYAQSAVCGDVVSFFKNQEDAIQEMNAITNETLMLLTGLWADEEEETPADAQGELTTAGADNK